MREPTPPEPSDAPWSTAFSEADTRAFPTPDPQDPTRPYSSQPATPAFGTPAPAPTPPAPSKPAPSQPAPNQPAPNQPQTAYPTPGPYQPPAPYQPQGPYPPYGTYQSQSPYQSPGGYQPPPPHPPGWGLLPPSGFPAPGSLPPRRRGPSAVVVTLVLLLTIATVTGATAWYLLLFQPVASPSVSPTPNVAIASPTSRSTPRPTPSPQPTPAPTAGPTAAPTATLAAAPTPAPSGTPALSAHPSAPTGRASPSAPASLGPSASIDPAIVSQIDAVVSEVPAIRGLQPTRTVPYRFITRDEFATEFQQQFATDNPPAEVSAEESLDKHLGLLPANADLQALEIQLYTSQVLAYYDTETKDFTVVEGATGTFTPADRVTVAHEYDHALQDQHWDLEKLQKVDPSEGDRSQAITALAEGDATFLMYQWAFQYLTPDEIQGLGTSGSPDDQQLLDSMPLLLRHSLLFPYLSGLQFISALQGQGGWDAVDAAWDNPPTSTEQILHPEKYTAGEPPIAIDLPDLAPKVGAGWSTATTETEGEMDLGIWLADGQDSGTNALGLPEPLPNADAAAGWGGDRLESLNGPNGTWAVVWQTAWDTPQDATEFSTAATNVMAGLSGAHALVASSVAGDLQSPVLVLVASDPSTLSQVQSALGVGQ